MPVWYTDIGNEIRVNMLSGALKKIDLPAGFQTFFLVYQCQRCLGTPEVFLVRRDMWSISLHGRSPMERVEVPNYIPQVESKFYRDALIAFNTGKTLAALFYLRTLIEQFARRLTRTEGKATGDEILDAYAKTLPNAHKEYMPSLRKWYDKLSEALHTATEDTLLFVDAKTDIEKHFEIRRVFKMPEIIPVKEDQKSEVEPTQGSDLKPKQPNEERREI